MTGKKRRHRKSKKPIRSFGKSDNKSQNSHTSRKHWAREWAEAIVFAFLAVLAIHTFIFQPFVVPTPSMANTIMPGDYVIISKLHYGARMPVSLGIPYTDIYIKGVGIPYFRLPGFSAIQHGDVVVFNVPNETEAVDRKTRYMKRVIGLPGDEVSLHDKAVYVNGVPAPETPDMQYVWNVYTNDTRVYLSPTRLRSLGITNIHHPEHLGLVRMQATRETMEAVSAWPYIDRVELHVVPHSTDYTEHMFPENQPYTPDNYGPITVPGKGDTVVLTQENWPFYRDIITKYEEHSVARQDDGAFEIDGIRSTGYTFEQNYYFMMGDNRDDSLDSRFWGYVPEDHIIGKTLATFFSWDSEVHRPRFHRMIRSVK